MSALRSAALRQRALGVLAGLTAFAVIAGARAAAPTTTKQTEPAQGDATSLGHAGQFGLRAGLTGAYQMLFRYDHSPPCAPWNVSKTASDQQKFCGVGAPALLDVAVGFAPNDSIEPFVLGRFGLGESSKTNSGAPLILAAGARIYTMSEERFKIFFSPWVGVDLTSGPASQGADFAPYKSTSDDYKTDLLLHIDAGPQFEISRAVGVYASGGLTFGMLRYLATDAELSLGVSLRAP